MEEEQEFLEKEIKSCNERINECKQTIDTALDTQKYWVRRREFLYKIENLITKN